MANNLTLYRGDTFPVNLALTSTSSSGTVVFPLAGYTAEVDFRWHKWDRISLSSTSTGLAIDTTLGTITGTFQSTDTACLPDNVDYYLVLTTTVPTRRTYRLGRVKVLSSKSSLEACTT